MNSISLLILIQKLNVDVQQLESTYQQSKKNLSNKNVINLDSVKLTLQSTKMGGRQETREEKVGDG